MRGRSRARLPLPDDRSLGPLSRADFTTTLTARSWLANILAVMNIDQGIPGLILNELVTNALKHGFPYGACGTIDVSLQYLNDTADSGQKLDEKTAVLCAKHNGVGMPDNVDFDTTTSMGLYLIRILTRQLHGSVELERGASTGSA